MSAIEQTGMDKVIETIQNIVSQNKKNKSFDERRAKQFTYWIEEEVREIIQFSIQNKIKEDGSISKFSKKIMNGEIQMFDAIEAITQNLRNK